MRLQELLLAQKIAVRECTAATRALLPTLDLDRLRDPKAWPLLRRLVKVKPCGDILPVRSTFGGGPISTNIALAKVWGLPSWYTLADVVGSYLLTGKVPEILEAIELAPEGPPVATKPWALFGEARYTIDLSKDDFFTAVINLRTRVQADQARARVGTAVWEQLDSMQRALKLLANATSYGVLVEINQHERTARPKRLLCFDDQVREVCTRVLETPGPYFCGAVGTLIPAAGRLLLAMCERLAADRGLTYAFCDTDSMAFARPDDMSREDFRRRVGEIVDYFTPLSPYEGRPPLLQVEKVNDADGEPEPLYCLAISAKRYALYNRLPGGGHRMRKFSSHGVGTWQKLKDYVPRKDIPCPCHGVVGCACLDCREHDCRAVGCPFVGEDGTRHDCEDATYPMGGAQWMHDHWYGAVEHYESLAQRRRAGEEIGALEARFWPRAGWLDVPARSQVTIATRQHYELFSRHFPALRPFNFITTLPALLPSNIMTRIWALQGDEFGVLDGDAGIYDGLEYQAFYEAPDGIRRIDTHERVSVQHRTLAECLRDYYEHPEAKAANPDGVGILDRRSVCVVDQVSCGKESNDIITELVDESEGVMPYPDAQTFGRRGLVEAIRAHGLPRVAEAGEVPYMTLLNICRGTRPNRATVRQILGGLDGCDPARGCCAVGTANGTAHDARAAEYEKWRRRRAATRRERRNGHVAGSTPEPEPEVGALREALRAVPTTWLADHLDTVRSMARLIVRHVAAVPASGQAALWRLVEKPGAGPASRRPAPGYPG
jgi:hypothetical protein